MVPPENVMRYALMRICAAGATEGERFRFTYVILLFHFHLLHAKQQLAGEKPQPCNKVSRKSRVIIDLALDRWRF